MLDILCVHRFTQIRTYTHTHAGTGKIHSDDDQHRHLNNTLCKCTKNKFDERNIIYILLLDLHHANGASSHLCGYHVEEIYDNY